MCVCGKLSEFACAIMLNVPFWMQFLPRRVSLARLIRMNCAEIIIIVNWRIQLCFSLVNRQIEAFQYAICIF